MQPTKSVYNHTMHLFAEPPVIDVKPDNQEVRSGDSFDLECAAKGRPAPSIKWYKDGEFLQTGASLRIESSSTGDEGTYRCEATNSVLNMTDWASANVSIIRELRIAKSTLFFFFFPFMNWYFGQFIH